MSATSSHAVSGDPGETNYLNASHGIGSWLLTRDHKRIGILYLLGISVFFVLGGLMAVLIRAELATPQGDLFSSDVYNRLFTMHGILMIFFFLIPSIPAVLGNFLLPIMIGAKDLAKNRGGGGLRERSSPRVKLQVSIDDRASPRHTVIEILARDRPGLLFAVSDALHRLGLSIAIAKINTEGTRVADVFYVSEREGGKIAPGRRTTEVHRALVELLESLEAEGAR